MTTQPTPRQAMVVQQTPSGGLVCERAGSSPQRQPIHARLIDANTIAAGGVRLVALNPIKSMCQRLVADGYDPAASLQIWRGETPWRLVFAIGSPDSHVKLKAKNGDC